MFLTRLLLPPKGVKIGFGGDEKVLLFMYQSTNIHRMIYGITIYLIFFFLVKIFLLLFVDNACICKNSFIFNICHLL